MWKAIAVVVVLIGGGAIAATFFGAWPVRDTALVSACETVVKKMLRAPTTYKRVATTPSNERISVDSYYAQEPTIAVREFRTRMAKQQGEQPIRHIVFLEYDAANAYGVPLRQIAKCSYETANGDASSVTEHSVLVNGKTFTEYLTDRAR